MHLLYGRDDFSNKIIPLSFWVYVVFQSFLNEISSESAKYYVPENATPSESHKYVLHMFRKVLQLLDARVLPKVT